MKIELRGVGKKEFPRGCNTKKEATQEKDVLTWKERRV